MTVNQDAVTGTLKVRFDRKPVAQVEWDLITDMKAYGFKWTGFGDDGKWVADKEAVLAFDQKSFRARVKLACKGLSFFDYKGKPVNMTDFMTSAKEFNPDDVDDDLSSLKCSQVKPETPSKPQKRGRE